MLLPRSLSKMRLGVKPPTSTFTLRAGAMTPVPLAYSRIESCPRIAGHNDQCGDCVETAAVNAVQTAAARAGDMTPLGDDLPQSIYEKVAGYDPSDPATDVGTSPEALFDWWKSNPIGGWRLAAVTPITDAGVMGATCTSGGVLLVVNLAAEQQNQLVWTPVGRPGSWGMHAIWCDEYDGGLLWCTTWGEAKPIAWSFLESSFLVGGYELGVVR